MGKVVNMFEDKGSDGLIRFLDSGFDASNLKQGEDFEVVSFIVMDHDYNTYSLGKFVDKSSVDIFKDTKSDFLNVAKDIAKEELPMMVFETKFPKNKENFGFYRVNCEIDIDLATEIGLGVVYYKGEYLLYFPSYDGKPKDIVYEMMMFKVYFQLLHPDIIDENLKNGFYKNDELIMSYMLINSGKHMNRLQQIMFGE